ncbi:GPI-anchored cell wall beta-1,3-endoglucanase EglC [Mytilinidion resinicola]|uniref:Probable glucan endo-1,3-beta-glucosidase eglC n=1 Tax=Mytilinidion resinicola TaxID=574789 RepID=A0A6A6YU79_9PEZI|nr:GPI-anchored cell wall beta-1,3-endoglucanase EglC [Mytilinidion resinicola]KAF2811943.1 GPI-anchored cell wall beta-1,3-endoglucanase EglC [Mytilinidion resinicola]
MRTSFTFGVAAAIATVNAQLRGFNYGSTFNTGANKQQSDFEAEFTTAQGLVGASGFTSARLYTMIQGGTTNTPISAIPAAISTKTTLLLGLWASAGSAAFNNEIAALNAAISQYGTSFTDLIVGISVGSEDLYRNSPTGIINNSGVGAQPDELVSYITQVRQAIQGTGASGAVIGHVDTWTAYVNASNNALISACDFLGMDAYPYFQNTVDNDIGGSNATFFDAYDATVGAAQGKPVWVTETGWPVSGPTENLAVASIDNAQTYWKQTACSLLGNINTFWYTLQDAEPNTPSPSFGLVGGPTLSTTPLFDLTCPAGGSGAVSR